MILGNVNVQIGQLFSVSADMVNSRNWTQVADESWRYTVDQEIVGDINIDSVTAEELAIVSEAGGTVTPSHWLQKSGGVISGKVSLADVSVLGDVVVADHIINDVNLENVLTTSNQNVRGVKRFQKLIVQQNVTANSVNSVSATDWDC